ncbi:GntR family transcriptional regulator [Pacificibacter maritimus]|uniref:GntR family transcriptional regulator n=1 Tax=Pacificibacter maritimus TaxID=762213 RepID=A0A3N4U774_9RHOB|nr:GntR family transcriptional regulator [Pacificibacter maritimus]RPE62951.1 GntR family transcriptional regulator [Pacificibacter maritimus]
MARSDRLYKRCYNDTLDLLNSGQSFRSVSDLANRLDVSRNTARRVIEALQDHEIIRPDGTNWHLIQSPSAQDYFAADAILTTDESIEAAFMEKVLAGRFDKNHRFSETALAKEFGVSNSAVREFLLRMSRFEFIKKEPQKSWILEGFSKKYAEDLHEVRSMFELRAIEKLILLPDDHRFWPMLHRMHTEHLKFVEQYKTNFNDFPALDSRFHRLLNDAADNRFFSSFQDAITLIFHYHFRWNKSDEKERNLVAAKEHLRIIEALLLKREDEALEALKVHLSSAKATLNASVNRSANTFE